MNLLDLIRKEGISFTDAFGLPHDSTIYVLAKGQRQIIDDVSELARNCVLYTNTGERSQSDNPVNVLAVIKDSRYVAQTLSANTLRKMGFESVSAYRPRPAEGSSSGSSPNC